MVGIIDTDTCYIVRHGVPLGADGARALKLSGLWDQALEVLDPDATALRAELLTDRFFWRLDGAAEAAAAVAELLQADAALGAFLDAQLAYTRVLFEIAPRPGDPERAQQGFAAAASDARLTNRATLWLGIVAENLQHDPGRARRHFTHAHSGARKDVDLLLESYALRHLGEQDLEGGDPTGLARLRRSYHLRAALGTRPQTAAAAATLATYLPEGDEAAQLSHLAAATARELHLTWLLPTG